MWLKAVAETTQPFLARTPVSAETEPEDKEKRGAGFMRGLLLNACEVTKTGKATEGSHVLCTDSKCESLPELSLDARWDNNANHDKSVQT
jgi:hypothetical protein